MSSIVILIVALAAIALALALAYLPMRILLTQMAKSATAPIRDFIQRQRDRREVTRETPDRRINR
jgi:CHASE1-domain containing sensor protein